MQTAVLNGSRHASHAPLCYPQPQQNISIVPDQEPVADPESWRAMIMRASRDPSFDADKFERMSAFCERMFLQERQAAFNEAMHAAQAEMIPVARDSYNKQTQSHYASLAAVDAAIRPIYTKHGFVLSFDTEDSPKVDHVRVVCIVARSGYERKYRVDMAADGKGAKGGDVMSKTHAGGSANTYGQRYLTTLIFNIVFVNPDDDGNAAGRTTTSADTSAPDLHIDAAQVKKLRDRIAEVGTKENLFLRYIGLDCLENIYKNKFDAAMAVLDRKATAKK